MEALLQQQRALEKDSDDTIQVLVRVRPPNERELSQVRVWSGFRILWTLGLNILCGPVQG